MTLRAEYRCLFVALVTGLCGCTRAAEDAGNPAALMDHGVGLLEQYNYMEAYKVFEGLALAHPTWEAAHVNKGIAALNLQNEYLKVAETEFAAALALNPKSLHALVSRSMLYKHTNRPDDWLRDADAAEKLDPRDPHVLYLRGEVLVEKGRVEDARAAFERVVKLQPSFSSAYWRLRESFVKSNEPQKMMAAIEAFKRLEASEMGVKFGLKYGEGGKYSLAIRGTVPPGWKGPAPVWKAAEAPVFGPHVMISSRVPLGRGRPDGRLQAPGLATGDLDGDGVLEIVLCGGEIGKGGEAAVADTQIYKLDASGAWKTLETLKDDAVSCALGDIDGDFDTDLVLAGDGWLRLYLNDGKGKLTATELKSSGASFAGFPVRLYVLDADSDWDLDIVCLRQEKTADGKVRSRLEILNNNRDGTFQEISAQSGIAPFDFPAVELVAADLDSDIDPDFLVFDGVSGACITFANDRVWRYHRVEVADAAPKAPGLVSTAGGDFDGDGDQDLVLFADGKLRFWRNVGGLLFEEDAAFTQRFGDVGGTAGVVADFLGALQPSIIALGSKGVTGAMFVAGSDAVKAVPIQLDEGAPGGEVSAMATVIEPCGAPALVIYDTARGARLHELAPPKGWLVLDLEGPQKPVPKLERSNAAGIGASVEVRVGTKSGRFLLDSGSGGSARSSPRVFCGLGGASSSDYVRILWPDSVLQSELSLVPGCVQKIKEIERKPTSCPILFAWTGSRYEFVADFLGVGGLGYLELPGVYTKPDPSEYVLLPSLDPIDGEYRLDIIEPLEECTYLDELKLTVVDHPADMTVIPEEMFAVKGPAPDFKLLAFREKVFAVRASNDEKSDVTSELRHVDRRYGNHVETDTRFPGLAKSMHWIDLDLGDGIRSLLEASSRSGRTARPYLFLHGYVEYGYSTSNFAAWQARAEFHAPSVRVEREGKWITLRDEWGFPAGYPRYMAIDLSGLLEPGDRRLRVDTNMDIHWDQAFLANANEEASLQVTDLDADVALLGFRGFPPEESPDGEAPLVYVHEGFEPEASYKTFPGSYTRLGDVRRLLSKADDGFAILGPGDGLSFSVHADRLPALVAGRKRTFLARTFGYCKDMDLYTAHPDRVEPLPFRAMSGYPFRTDEAAPAAAAREAYSHEWNTRVVK